MLQKNPPDLTEGLLRLECTSSLELRLSYRPFSIQNEQVDAITVPSKVWPKRVAGTKHGEWKSYGDARERAERHGADLALLIHNYSILIEHLAKLFYLMNCGALRNGINSST